jgi:hypothetical protein
MADKTEDRVFEQSPRRPPASHDTRGRTRCERGGKIPERLTYGTL